MQNCDEDSKVFVNAAKLEQNACLQALGRQYLGVILSAILNLTSSNSQRSKRKLNEHNDLRQKRDDVFFTKNNFDSVSSWRDDKYRPGFWQGSAQGINDLAVKKVSVRCNIRQYDIHYL